VRQISRRHFLRESSGLAAAAATLARSGRVFSAEARGIGASVWEEHGQDAHATPHIHFPTAARARLSVSSYPFRDFIEDPSHPSPAGKQPRMKLQDFGAMVAEKFQLHNIEPWSAHFKSTEPAYLAELRAAFDKAGAHVINIPADISHSVYDPDSAKRAQALREGKTWVEAASALGSPSVRIHIAETDKVKPDVERAATSLRQVADYGARKNIVVNLENDDLVSEDAFFVVAVIEKANHPYLHALPDFANSMMTGNADFNYRAVEAMFKHAYCISHVKEGEDGPNGKFIAVDVPRTFGIAKAAGYRGYFSMEMDRQGDPYSGTQKLIDLSLQNIT